MCNVFHYSFFVSFTGHYMFRPNWPSSGVQVKESAAHCNTVIFPPNLVASGYFDYVGCGCLECSYWNGSFVVCCLN
jgi:hypothetical protein